MSKAVHQPDPVDALIELRRRQATVENRVKSRLAVRATRSTTQSISSGGFVALNFDQTRWDYGAIKTSNTEFTAPAKRLYEFGASVDWDSNATGERSILLVINNVLVVALVDAQARAGVRQEVTSQWELDAGEWVEAWVFQNSGGPRTIEHADAFSPEFWMAAIE